MLGILKIFILFFVFVICYNIGLLKAKTYENRVTELKNVKSGLEVLKTKIEFTYEPIREIFSEIARIVYEKKENIFSETIKQMEKNEVSESWNIAVNKNANLNTEDKNTIKMFGKLLGKTDKSGQINEINITSKLLDNLIEKAEEEKSKNYKLFKTLGSLIGVGLCIILI